jgi:hypothetical protein
MGERYDGLRVIQVHAGYALTDDEGRRLVVDDEHAVRHDGTVYVTGKVFEALKRAVPATPTPSDPRLRGDTAPGEVSR